MTDSVLIIMALGALALIALNVLYWRETHRLQREERQKLEDEMRDEMRPW